MNLQYLYKQSCLSDNMLLSNTSEFRYFDNITYVNLLIASRISKLYNYANSWGTVTNT